MILEPYHDLLLPDKLYSRYLRSNFYDIPHFVNLYTPLMQTIVPLLNSDVPSLEKVHKDFISELQCINDVCEAGIAFKLFSELISK